MPEEDSWSAFEDDQEPRGHTQAPPPPSGTLPLIARLFQDLVFLSDDCSALEYPVPAVTVLPGRQG